MSKKDYSAIAETIRQQIDNHPDSHRIPLEVLAKNLCRIFLADNPRFDSRRFLSACGIQS